MKLQAIEKSMQLRSARAAGHFPMPIYTELKKDPSLNTSSHFAGKPTLLYLVSGCRSECSESDFRGLSMIHYTMVKFEAFF